MVHVWLAMAVSVGAAFAVAFVSRSSFRAVENRIAAMTDAELEKALQEADDWAETNDLVTLEWQNWVRAKLSAGESPQ